MTLPNRRHPMRVLKNMLRRCAAVLGGVVLAAGTASGATLKVGDPAPALRTGRWIQGEPVRALERGQAYLLEFWATWCGPCVEAIPDIDAIHRKYRGKGLVVIGQNVREEDEKAVERFVKKRAARMTYRVALDDRSGEGPGAMQTTWMEASDAQGIPTTFLVNREGRVAWIGHPWEVDDALIERVLDGKQDLTRAATDQAAKKQVEEALERAMTGKDWAAAKAQLDRLDGLTSGRMKAVMEGYRFFIHLESKDLEGARRFADQYAKGHPDDPELQAMLASMALSSDDPPTEVVLLAEGIARGADALARGTNATAVLTLGQALLFQGREKAADEVFARHPDLGGGDADTKKEALSNIALVRFEAAVRKKDAAGAHRLAEEVCGDHPEDGSYSNFFVRRFLDDPRLAGRDLARIETMARRTVESTGGKDGWALSSLARVQFVAGRKDEAIATQEKAVARMKNEPAAKRARFEKALEAYRAGKLPADD